MLMMLQEQQRMMAEQHQAQQRVLLEMLQTQQEEQRAYRQEMEELRHQEAVRHREETRHKLPKPVFKKLEETDDIENFLETFERVATQHDWPENAWAVQLAGLLTGRAQAAYAALDATEAQDYKKVKEAILHRYDVNQETHRRRFREDRKKPEESYREWLWRITNHFDKWCKDSTMPMKELVVMEQALWGMPEGLTVWLRERQPKSLEELAKLAEDYTLARKGKDQPFGTRKPLSSPGTPAVETQGTRAPHKRNGFRTEPRTKVKAAGEKQCFHCHQWGHLKYNCPKRSLSQGKADSKPAFNGKACEDVAWPKGTEKYLKWGKVGGKSVQMLLDSGCSRTMVSANSVDSSKISKAETVAVLCVHGDTVEYPTAMVELALGGHTRKANVAIAPSLPVPVLLGRDLYDIRSGWKSSDTGYMVETRSQKKIRESKSMDDLMDLDEQAILSELFDQSLKLEVPEANLASEEHENLRREDMAENTSTLEEEMNAEPVSPLDASKEQIQAWQESDATLVKVRDYASSQPEDRTEGENVFFYRKDGLLYRHWQPRKRGKDGVQAVEQLVLPTQCRQLVLRLAHDVPTAGHLGVTKTRNRVLQRYYWPGVFKEVTEYCTTCEVCQRSRGRRPARAPLVSMPLIQKPFSRIAMDIVGPLPRTQRGNRYILTICDYATRYPEAIPLPSVEATRVARELLLLFTRVGVPEEVLSDQGTNFMSSLLDEMYQALQITRIRTTPYHPQTDGLVERFNATLKSMLRKFTSRNQKDWDEYLPYLLFSYREVPQESTGFSPFELLYRHRVRGPLDVIREGWTEERSPEFPVIAHVVQMRDRLEEMMEIVQETTSKAQQKQKRYYDKGTKKRELKAGDQVLVLLPKDENKLKLEWVGPYKVLRAVTPVDYEVATPGRRQKKKIYHINLLKLWKCPTQPVSNLMSIMEEGNECDEEESTNLSLWEPEETLFDVTEIQTPDLNPEERKQLLSLVQEFDAVCGPAPGRTTIAEHEIFVADETPIQQRPYRVPYSRREVVKEEIHKMLEADVIRPSTSPWASPIVMVGKKDGSVRFCVDYRKLNKVARFDAYPMPRIEELLDNIGPARYITTMDLAKGYWQIPLEESSKEKSAFTTPFGLYEFQVMPFGLHNAPATFQRTMNRVLEGCEEFAGCYIDDLVVYSKSWEEHLQHLQVVLERLQAAKLTLKPRKCQFGRREVRYLGHVIGGGKVRPDPQKLQAVAEYPRPQTKKDVRAFLGLVGYYRKFTPNFADIAVPLTDLTRKKKPEKVIWTGECDQSFIALKETLLKHPVLEVFDPNKQFLLQTDASERGLGAVLSQRDSEGQENPIAFASRKLQPRERNYATIEKECLAVVWALKIFYTYLYGRKIEVQTDHQPLAWLHKMQNANARLTRWALAIQPYQLEITHRRGVSNGNADGLSRAGPLLGGRDVAYS
ncbi:uncharacterized protein LOC135337548 [Halichondria panicea]|uniref:uncharacterized protein LOC135337548 n=1 Tax=Halichondria panicea TaxID=6063 RepID=UPI00312B971B